MSDGVAPDGEPFVLPECGFTAPEGKVFAGWSIGGKIVEAGGSYTFTSDMTVLAVWKDVEAEVYRVTFLPNGGTGTAPVIADTAEGGTFRLPANPFNREGYQFIGWRCGGAVYQPGDTFTMPGHDVTFSAQWNPIAYAITGRVLKRGVGVPGATVRLMLIFAFLVLAI